VVHSLVDEGAVYFRFVFGMPCTIESHDSDT